MANQNAGKQKNKPQNSCPDGNASIRGDRSSGRFINICPSLKRKQKISFDTSDKLAEEIAALRDKKS